MARVDKIPIRRQGEDIPITILLKTSSGAVSIDDLAECFVYLMSEYSSAAVAKWSKAGTQEGCTALVKVDSTHYRADWLSADTKEATLGEYYLEVNMVETDAEYNDSEKNTIPSDTVFELQKSTVKDQSS